MFGETRNFKLKLLPFFTTPFFVARKERKIFSRCQFSKRQRRKIWERKENSKRIQYRERKKEREKWERISLKKFSFSHFNATRQLEENSFSWKSIFPPLTQFCQTQKSWHFPPSKKYQITFLFYFTNWIKILQHLILATTR